MSEATLFTIQAVQSGSGEREELRFRVYLLQSVSYIFLTGEERNELVYLVFE